VWSFTSGSGGTILPPPTLVAPADGSTLASLPVTFQWLPVDGTIEYKVTWGKASEPNIRYTDWVTGTQLTTDWHIDPSIAYDIVYEWYVSARNDYAIGQSSDIWQFTTPPWSSSTGCGDEWSHWVQVDEDNTMLFFAGASAK